MGSRTPGSRNSVSQCRGGGMGEAGGGGCPLRKEKRRPGSHGDVMWRPLSLNPALQKTESDPVCEERREQKTLFPEAP